jgi:hypothetical protein
VGEERRREDGEKERRRKGEKEGRENRYRLEVRNKNKQT